MVKFRITPPDRHVYLQPIHTLSKVEFLLIEFFRRGSLTTLH